jgi:FKBP-type peptidyl-prolyl cis-trans isomerase
MNRPEKSMRSNLFSLSALILVFSLIACSSESDAQGTAEESMAEVSLDTEDQKTLYALGLAMAQQLAQFDLSAEDLDLVKNGLSDGTLGTEPKVALEEFMPKLQSFAQSRAGRVAEREKAAGKEFLTQMATEAGAEVTDSGLVFTEITAGTGANPAATDKVKVHYHGTLRDGTVFDSSVDRGEPVEFGLNQVIACWTEGVQKIKVGGKAKLVCPSEIAYGDTPRPPKIPGGATLVFEVELIEITTPSS